MEITDSIEQEIRIEAPMVTVWPLVSEPGWWINEGTIEEHRIEHRDGYDLVHSPSCGEFEIETVEARDGEYAAYRWTVDHDRGDNALHNLVEFWLTADEQATVLRVRESGFLEGGMPQDARRRNFELNVEGWDQELTAARKHLER